PWSAPPLPRQPAPPVILRDAGLPDQPLEAAARRRGAYAALDKVTAMQARELVAAVTGGYGAASWRGAGAFAERVLRDRDPHLVREGEAIAEALAAAGGVVDGVRVAAPGTLVADGVATTDVAAPAPAALIAL